MKRHARILCAAAMLAIMSTAAFAAGGGGGGGGGGEGNASAANDDAVVVAAKAAIARQDWLGAQAGLKQALADKPNNANYHNLYAYSMRKGPNPDMEQVFKHYNEALRIDPRHKGAHEYIGEAYLQVGDLAKAKEHLAALDRICFFGCEEYTDLKKDVAEYEAKMKR